MSETNMLCPFCGCALMLDYYKDKRSSPPKYIVFCDNELCPVQPCTDASYPTRVFDEARHFGKIMGI